MNKNLFAAVVSVGNGFFELGKVAFEQKDDVAFAVSRRFEPVGCGDRVNYRIFLEYGNNVHNFLRAIFFL